MVNLAAPKQGILITGGAGYFGRAFARRALADGVQRVCIYSRGEVSQARMRSEFGDDSRLRFFVGDVRDRARLQRAMEGCTTVIAASALKRIEVGVYCPDELVKTNVIGAMNTIEAAVAAGVEKVIFISSDKAWQPISPYGQTKALAESLFLAANNVFPYGPRFCSVRYGNIWNSTWSVVPTWRDILAQGGRVVPVTDPDCTRFFMRIEEAVRLVSETTESMKGGELVIPESLPAYRLGDLAEAMAAEMNVIGLPSHEKKHEGMRDGLTSDVARRMSVAELREALAHV